MKRFRTQSLSALLMLVPMLASGAQQTKTLPQPDERFKVDILLVVAHPDDEGAATPYLARALDVHRRGSRRPPSFRRARNGSVRSCRGSRGVPGASCWTDQAPRTVFRKSTAVAGEENLLLSRCRAGRHFSRQRPGIFRQGHFQVVEAALLAHGAGFVPLPPDPGEILSRHALPDGRSANRKNSHVRWRVDGRTAFRARQVAGWRQCKRGYFRGRHASRHSLCAAGILVRAFAAGLVRRAGRPVDLLRRVPARAWTHASATSGTAGDCASSSRHARDSLVAPQSNGENTGNHAHGNSACRMDGAKRHREILSGGETDGSGAIGSKFAGAGGECAEEIRSARSHRSRRVEWAKHRRRQTARRTPQAGVAAIASFRIFSPGRLPWSPRQLRAA